MQYAQKPVRNFVHFAYCILWWVCYNKYRIKRGASTTDNWGVVDLTKPVAFWLGVCNPSKTFQKNKKKCLTSKTIDDIMIIVNEREVMIMNKEICFDMDGTIADLYSVNGWLDYLIAEDVTPYAQAKVMLNMSALARHLNRLQRKGYTIKIISWLSKNGSDDYNDRVTETKKAWLKKHLASVHFDDIIIVKYGTPKQTLGKGILFDDEIGNRQAWNGIAYDVNNILEILKNL